MAKFGLDDLQTFNSKQIDAAGPRYSPNIDIKAPNLQITDLLSAIDALSLTPEYRTTLQKLRDGVAKAISTSSSLVSRLFKHRRNTPDRCLSFIDELLGQKPGHSAKTLRRLNQAVRAINSTVATRRRFLFGKRDAETSETRRSTKIDLELDDLNKLSSAVSKLLDFCESPAFTLIGRNRLLVRGSWGTGKTHSLCDIAKARMARNLPTLFALGHRVQSDANPLASLCEVTALAKTPTALLTRLSELAKAAGGRALLIIDGINEGDRRGWVKYAASIAQLLGRYPNVGLILSCRSPFETQVFTDKARRLFVDYVHVGFEGVEFDAQQEFFRFYGIPNPHIPLLAVEFSRPLFLKILCQTFSGQTASACSHWIRDLMAGQKTMTKLLEDFVTQVGGPIEHDFGLQGKACWRILKGAKSKTDGTTIGVAPAMAATLLDYVSPADCISIIAQAVGYGAERATRLFYRLVADGLLVEDLIYRRGGSENIVRLPYQRFSDHLVCRHLLENYLDIRTKVSIRRSLYSNKPLGRIFDGGLFINSYAMPGWATALILEFPERTKRILSDDERELLFHLPKKNRGVGPLIAPFLEGLTWRHSSSFSQATDRIISFFLEKGRRELQHQTFEVLVGLASRLRHPYSAERLSRYLQALSLVDRDLRWSEFIRCAQRESVVRRLVEWTIRHASEDLSAEAARNMLVLCATFLTTTQRAFRDRTTRALVVLGERYPLLLFEITTAALSSNDPYIPERLLAASYGVMMRRWSQSDAAFRAQSSNFARNLFDNMFAIDAQFSTSHAHMRDYALGVIDLARRIDPKCLASRPIRLLRPPFRHVGSRIPAGDMISDSECEAADIAIGMDFRNYTVGRLVPDRGNYDFDNPDHKETLRQIMWRMLDLGYKPELFKESDEEIASLSYRSGRTEDVNKVDRYGKKYSWISFFEVAGLRADRGKLKNPDDPRLSDCDIDPSFPIPSATWTPPLHAQFDEVLTSPSHWAKHGAAPSYQHLLSRHEVDGISGPWVLLHGQIQESAPNDPRRTFTFLRSMFVRSADADFFRRAYARDQGERTDDIGEDHYVFLGEIPWSAKHGWYLRDKRGRAKPQLVEIFGGTRRYSVRKKIESLEDIEEINGGLVALLNPSVAAAASKLLKQSKTNKKIAFPRYIEIPKYKHIPGIKVEFPSFHFGWESYHSNENEGPNPDFVAPAISQAFQLAGRMGGSDLFDPEGKQATIFRRIEQSDGSVGGRLLYLRKDLLEEYLDQNDRFIAWVNSGERTFHHEFLNAHRNDFREEWDLHRHRQIVTDIPKSQ